MSERRPRILIVEDRPTIIELFEIALAGQAHVIATTQAREAIEMIRIGETFDLIFCGMTLEDFDGVRFYVHVRRLDPDLLERIVFLVSHPITEPRQAFLESVPNLWLMKPVGQQRIRDLVKSRLGVPQR